MRSELSSHETARFPLFVLSLVLLAFLAGCSPAPPTVAVTESMKLAALETIERQEMPEHSGWEFDETDDGVRYVNLVPGSGDNVWYDDEVRVHYYLWLTDGTLVDSSREGGVSRPLEFTVGEGRVIRGWEELIREMNLGSEVLAVVPWKLGYGRDGGRGIPRKADLVFYVKLLRIR